MPLYFPWRIFFSFIYFSFIVIIVTIIILCDLIDALPLVA